jgi:Nickel responsive protein SCO4226-like
MLLKKTSRVAAPTKRRTMPLYMDVHNIDGGVSAEDVAGAHQADVETQDQYGVDYKRYWVDEEAGKIFCLVDAPDSETAARVHREAHGLVADEIYQVSEGT